VRIEQAFGNLLPQYFARTAVWRDHDDPPFLFT
jgi:hypothetical protein